MVAGAQVITISDVTLNSGGTGSATLTLDSAPHGLSGFKIYLDVTEPTVAEVASVTYPNGFSMKINSQTPFTSGMIKAADPAATFVPDGSRNIQLATVTLKGLSPGSARLHGTVSLINGNLPWADNYTPTTSISDGTILVTSSSASESVTTPSAYSGVLALPGQASLPEDPLNAGMNQDLNGDGVVNFSDVSLYFNNFEWIQNNEPVALFDYNKNGIIDFGDVVTLNEEA